MKRQPLWLGTFLLSFSVGIAAVALTYMSAKDMLIRDEKVLAHVGEAESLQPSLKEKRSEERSWEDKYSNETEIGRRGKNKIEVLCLSKNDLVAAKIEFFSKGRDGEWTRRQSLSFENPNYAGCDAQISDFNNDGYKDLTFRSGQAARGANEIRTLLVYDSKKDELIFIKNSAEYPNLAYNKKLDCLDSLMFHGATTTVFLRIEGDELKDFASVDTGADLVVTLRGKFGQKEIYRKKMRDEDIYTRYSTYDPPKP